MYSIKMTYCVLIHFMANVSWESRFCLFLASKSQAALNPIINAYKTVHQRLLSACNFYRQK